MTVFIHFSNNLILCYVVYWLTHKQYTFNHSTRFPTGKLLKIILTYVEKCEVRFVVFSLFIYCPDSVFDYFSSFSY